MLIWELIHMNSSLECMTRKIGSFWQVNPLPEEYVQNGTYVFSGNKKKRRKSQNNYGKTY